MPIYEFACPKCRVIFSFLSKRVGLDKTPACPRCGGRRMRKQMSGFSMGRRSGDTDPAVEGAAGAGPGGPEGMPDIEDPRVARALGELERDMDHLDENNPKHLAHMLRKMKDVLPQNALPGEFDVAIRRLESGEDPEKIEEDMGDVLDPLLGGAEGGEGGGGGGFSKDPGLYDL